jgi:hypothetical protein
VHLAWPFGVFGDLLAECQVNGALSFSSGPASYNTNMSAGLSVQTERAPVAPLSPETKAMLKKTLLAAAALSFLALGATSPADAYYNGNNNHNYIQHYNQNNNQHYNQSYDYDNYKNKSHHHQMQYGYQQYHNFRPYPWWLQYYGWNFGRRW